MEWNIQFDSRVIKDMKKIDEPVKRRIWESINNMLEKPETADIKKLKGKASEYRLRVGDWRVRFQVDYTRKTYFVTHVKHRRDIYS